MNIVLIIYLGKLLARQRAERKCRLSANMKSTVSVLLILALAVVRAGGAVHAAQTAEDLQPEVRMPANSNVMEAPVPQLAGNLEALSQAPAATNLTRIAEPPPAPVGHAGPRVAERRRTVWLVVLVLAVVAGSYFLQRLRSRSDPP